MTLEDMDASELRAELADAVDQALKMSQNLSDAVKARQFVWADSVARCALDPALARVERIRRLMKLGVAA